MGIHFIPLNTLSQQRVERLFKTYSAKEGLSINSIYYIEKSPSGFLWISTPIGLQRFNGYEFESWNKPADASSPSSLRIFFTKEDSQNNLWVFTFERPFVFQKNKKEYQPVPHKNLDSLQLTNLKPSFERAGRIWCFNHRFGLVGLNTTTLSADSIIDLSPKLKFIRESFLPITLTVSEDENGTNWLGGSFGDSNFILSVDKNLQCNVQVFPVRTYGVLKAFIATIGNEYLFCSTTQTFICNGANIERPTKILSKENIPGNYYRSFCHRKLKVFNKGNILFPGNSCIWEYNPYQKTLQPYSINQFTKKTVSRQLIFSIEEDDNGNIWIGRDAADGLLVYYPSKLRFNLLEAPEKYFNLVYSLTIDEDENLYAANYEKGINVFDTNGIFKKHIPLRLTENNLHVSVRCMAFADKDHLLLKSLYGLLMYLDIRTEKLINISSLIPPHVKSIPLPFDVNIIKTPQGNLLFFVNNYLLEFVSSGNSYKVNLIDSIFVANPISSVALSPGNNITIAAGSFIYQKREQGWVKISDSLEGGLKQINYDQKGNLWVATTRGIHKIAPSGRDQWFTQRDGLADEFIYGILFDEFGNAWFSSNRGLGCIQSSGAISIYSEDDGVQGEEFDTQSFCKGKSGKLFFGGIKGISSFYPKDILQAKKPGQVWLTRLMVNGEEYLPTQRLDSLGSIQLSNTENILTFNFSLNDFTDPESNIFQVKMQGLDKDWSLVKNIHSLRYLLQPGSYTFLLKGSSDGSTWTNEYRLGIIILPAWWQTTIFRLGLVLVIGTLIAIAVILYNRNRRNKLLQVQRELQKERERISRDLHDNIGAYASAMISHMDSLKNKFPEDEQREAIIEPIREDANQILGSLRETIWILKNEEMRLTDFADGFKMYASKILKNFEGCSIEFKEAISNVRKLSPSQALHLYRILQEALQNTIKHSKATKIDFSIEETEKIRLTYQDNGIGFDISTSSE